MGVCSSQQKEEKKVVNSKTTDISITPIEDHKRTQSVTKDTLSLKHSKFQHHNRECSLPRLQSLISESSANIFKNYTMIDLGYRNSSASTQKYITIQHNISGVVRFARVIAWDGQHKPPYIHWLLSKHLNHPNICNVYEIYNDKNNYYLVQEYCSGGYLSDYIADKQITEIQLQCIVRNILSVINYFSSFNLIHGTLSLDSFMVEDDSGAISLKLLDMEPYCEKKEITLKNINFVAPEVINRHRYQPQSDIWSLGIITYYLISGQFPFDKDNQNIEQIKRNILRGALKLEGTAFDRISQKGIQFIKKVLEVEFFKRWTVQECLQYPWVSQGKDIYKKKLNAINQMINLKQVNQLQAWILLFIINHFCSKQKEVFLEIFQEFDANSDQKISQSELLNVYQRLYQNQQDASEQVKKIFQNVDADHNGSIDLEEFIIATIDKKALLTQKHLEQVFKIIDKDRNGKITVKEIRNICTLDMEVIQNLIKQVDKNSDGCLNLIEFKSLMLSLL